MFRQPEATDDPALIRMTAGGDSSAFTELYDRHSTLVFSIALKILEDREEAQDVKQQVFLKLLKNASSYNPDKGMPTPWLAAMARNQSLDRLRQIRSLRRHGEKLYQEAAAAAPPGWQNHGYAHFNDEVELLHGAMAALRPEEVHVLRLAYFGGLSQTEISTTLAQPLGSIKARTRRALVKLRVALEGIVDPECSSPAGMLKNGFKWRHGQRLTSPLMA